MRSKSAFFYSEGSGERVGRCDNGCLDGIARDSARQVAISVLRCARSCRQERFPRFRVSKNGFVTFRFVEFMFRDVSGVSKHDFVTFRFAKNLLRAFPGFEQ